MPNRRPLFVALLLALSQPALAADEAKADDAKLDAVVVTAQSRVQEAQQVPIPLQFVAARDIERVEATDLSRMDLFVPGLVVDGSQPTQPHYSLRGIATDDFGVGTDPSVGVYVDGVYAARSGGALLAFNDVKRIEVLKGPQGTLFGRNAAAGAISIVTNDPGNQFEARGRVRVGEYGKRYGDALLNAPLSDDVALRISAVDVQSDGWHVDTLSNRHFHKDDQWGARMALAWNAPGDTRVLLSYDHEKLEQPPRPALGVTDPAAASVPYPPNPATFVDPLHTLLINDAAGAEESRRFDGVTLSIDHPFAWGTLVSTTAWRDFDTLNREDNDGTGRIETYLDTANIEDNRSFYQELKFSGNNAAIDWVAGASFYRERARQTSQANTTTDSLDTLFRNVAQLPTPDGSLYGFLSAVLADNGIPISLLGLPWREAISNRGTFEAAALFGDVIWHLNDTTNLTTGLRYTHDSKDFSWYNAPRASAELDGAIAALEAAGFFDAVGIPADALRGNVIFADPGTVGATVKRSDSWNDFSPRAVLDHHFSPELMAYVSATKGYKAGGFNSVQIGSRFEPERVRNFEAGIKSSWPDQHLTLNGSVYYYVYSNRQSLRLDPAALDSGVPQYIVDSSDQDATGADIEAAWQPNASFKLTFNGAYIDARFRDKVTPEGVDLSDQPTGEPRWSFAAGADYTWHDVFDGALELSAAHAYRGRTRCNDDAALQGACLTTALFEVGEAQNRTDLRLAYRRAQWGAAVFVNNVFDQRYVIALDNITTSTFGTPFAQVSAPRMAGVEVSVRF